MTSQNIVSKLIDLQDKANAHASEYERLQNIPGQKTVASAHLRKAVRLRAQIQKLIHQLAANGSPQPPANMELPHS